MSKKLVIVESPAKARTINRILGGGYEVKASMGHVRDLPKNELGVDEDSDFKPTYVTLPAKNKVIADLRRAAKDADAVYLAADHDREGESICFHLVQILAKQAVRFYRVVFNEITSPAVKRAFESPGEVDMHKVDAQQARRILDRLVGYKISPLLWRRVKRGLSAGRVQSVALRLIVEREREIKAFVSEEYWKVTAELLGKRQPSFNALAIERDGSKLELRSGDQAERVVADLRKAAFSVRKITVKARRRTPPQPFITSTLQQEAFRKLGLPVARTMKLAQQLYEGVPLGDEGAVGLITYMRTDSTRVADEAGDAARGFIAGNFGPDYLPARPPKAKKVKAAQEAHEAIRPTYISRTPESLQGLIDPALLKLYTLIWKRFIASQMREAKFEATTVDIEAGPYTLRATGNRLLFDGFLRVLGRVGVEEDEDKLLPLLEEGEPLKLIQLLPSQHFTQPPPRFSEAGLVQELEKRGIGRPSTYATIISTILNRDYVVKAKGRLHPTDLGIVVTELLEESFSDLMDYEYTARMESALDKIEEGEENWVAALRRFNTKFNGELEAATNNMRNLRREGVPTDEKCPECGAPMVKRVGRYGPFLSCSRYPECKGIRKVVDPAAEEKKKDLEAASERIGPQVSDVCGTPLALRSGRYGLFLGCTRYPECRYTVPVKKDGTVQWDKAKRDLCAEKNPGAPPESPKKKKAAGTKKTKAAGRKKPAGKRKAGA